MHSAIAAAALLFTFFSGLDNVPFHRDESRWIAESYRLEAFFRRDMSDASRAEVPERPWAETYWTLTQPPLGRQIVGLGRLAGGYRIADTNLPWDFSLSEAENVEQGRQPGPRLLRWGRVVPTFLAAMAGLILFGVIRRYSGLVAAYAFLVLLLVNPYLMLHARRAMAEGTLLFFVAMALLAGERYVRSGRDRDANAGAEPAPAAAAEGSPGSLGWLLAMAVCSGLAAAVKLNATALAAAGALIGALRGLWDQSLSVALPTRRRRMIRNATLAGLASACAFIAVNPYTYINPIVHSAKLFHFRAIEMGLQYEDRPATRLDSLQRRIDKVPKRVFSDYVALRFPGAWAINAALIAIGLAGLAVASRRELRGRRPGVSTLITAAGVLLAIPPLFTPLDWPRYYLFPIFFGTICIALGLAWTLAWLGGSTRERQGVGSAHC